MNNLKVGTELVIVKSSPERCSSLQVGQRLTISAVRADGYYDTGHWNLALEDGVLVLQGLPDVVFEVFQEEPVEVQDTTDYKRIALMQHLSCAYDDVEDCGYDYEADGASYRVLTEDEADEAFEAALDSVLDECILPDLDGALQCYFDRDAWKRDASYDGRGHHLNHYDGCEDEVTVNGVDYYIYRTN